MTDVSPRIFLRPIGSPLAVAMSGLAIGSLMQSGVELGWVQKRDAVYIGLILIAVPFILQFLACVFAYLARDGAAGAAIAVLSTTWLAIGLVDVVSQVAQRNSALGLLLIVSAGVLVLSALAVGTAKPLPALVFTCAATRFVLAGIYQLGGVSTWKGASGILGLVVVGLAGYSVLAFELEGQERRPVLPTFRRRRGRQAIEADAAAQLVDVANEAGVRQTT